VDVVEIAKALASPTRVSILGWLKDPDANFVSRRPGDLSAAGVCASLIAEKAGIAAPTASRHLDVLRRAGLILALTFGALGIALIPLLTGGFAILGGVGYGTYLAVRGRSDGRPVTFSRLAGWVGLGAGAMLAAFALAFASAWATAEGSGAVIAALVIAIGGLLVGSATRSRGARWLALPALLLAVPLGVVAAADVSFDGGFGERSYRPASVADLPRDGYRLGAGELVVDLRDVDLPAGRETVLDLRLGMGSAEVLVSEDVCVITDTRVGGGYVNLRGRDSGGLDVDFLVRADTNAAPRLLVRGDIGLGALEIIDEPYGSFDGRRRFDRDGSDGFNFGDTTVEDGACSRVEIASAG